jgi:hypothetical protein
MDEYKGKNINRNTAIIGAACLTIALLGGLIGILVTSYSNGSQYQIHPEVSQYIGKWKNGRTMIKIEARPEKKIKKSFTLKDGSTANLLLPVRVRNVRGRSLDIMIKEGIYEIGGEHGLIYLCKLCKYYIVFGFDMEDGNLLIGIPKYGFNDRHIHDFVGRHRKNWKGVKWGKFKLGNLNWTTYERVAEEEQDGN